MPSLTDVMYYSRHSGSGILMVYIWKGILMSLPRYLNQIIVSIELAKHGLRVLCQ